MRAAVLTDHSAPLVVEELSAAPLGPTDVRLRIEASGVCHSDLTAAQGGVPMATPVILGHEASGTVVEVGDAVTRTRVGDRVITTFMPACGNCWYCRHDRSNLCTGGAAVLGATRGLRADGTAVRGMTGLGTFADEVTVSELQAVPVESDLPAEQLALIGCAIATGVGAVLNTARVEPGATVAVIGCGGVGQAVVQGARVAGAARIFAVDPVRAKRDWALRLGATDGVDPGEADPVAQVKERTRGLGADHVFEVIGLPDTINQAFRTARPGGNVVIVGMPRADATVTMPAFPLFFEEKRLCGCMYGTSQVRRDLQRYVDLVEAGRLDVGSMVTRRVPLEQVNEAFAAMSAGEVIRSVIV